MNRTQAYQVLGLSSGASETAIKKAFRRLVKKLHPDVNPEPGAQQQFVQVKQAFDCLLSGKPDDFEALSAEKEEEAFQQARRRKEQWERWRRREEEKALQRLLALQQLYRIMNYLIACCLLYAGFLALDYALPPTEQQEEIVAVEKIYESAGFRGGGKMRYSYDEVYFRNYKLRVVKGEAPVYAGEAIVYVSPVFQIVRKAVLRGKSGPLVLEPAYGFYATFGFLIPLTLLLGLSYFRLPLSGEARLNVGLVVLFIGLFHLVLALLL